MNAFVKNVMTTHVIAVRRGASFKEMAARLREHRVSAFPVLDDDDKVIGVVSEADLLPETATVGHDMIEEIRYVEGVVTVRDRLSYPPAERRVPVSNPLF